MKKILIVSLGIVDIIIGPCGVVGFVELGSNYSLVPALLASVFSLACGFLTLVRNNWKLGLAGIVTFVIVVGCTIFILLTDLGRQ